MAADYAYKAEYKKAPIDDSLTCTALRFTAWSTWA
jgi:hypothetical protein